MSDTEPLLVRPKHKRTLSPKTLKIKLPKKQHDTPVATVYMPDGTTHEVTPNDGIEFTLHELQAMVQGTREHLPSFQLLGNEPGFRPVLISENKELTKYACLVDEDGRHAYGNVKNGHIGYINQHCGCLFDPVGPVAVMLQKYLK